MVKVSVLMVTYNHEDFIKDAIDSVLMQITNFDFELVIGEDCSTDDTRSIILDYQERFPNIIKLNLQNSNLGGRRNFISSLALCSGNYIALLEGDDYWIDEKKLQKQVDYLEDNLDSSCCVHSYKRFHQDSGEFLGDVVCKSHKLDLEGFLIEDSSNEPLKWDLRTLSIMFRKRVIDNPPPIWYEVPYGDYILAILCLEKGYAGFIEDVMGVYRINSNSITQKNASRFFHQLIDIRRQVRNYLPDKYKSLVQKSIDNKLLKKSHLENTDKLRTNLYNRNIRNYLNERNYKSIAIYGLGTLGGLLMGNLKDTDIKVVYLIDKNLQSVDDKVILKPHELSDKIGIDVIIVTPTYQFIEIKEYLIESNVDVDIISLSDILDSIPNETNRGGVS